MSVQQPNYTYSVNHCARLLASIAEDVNKENEKLLPDWWEGNVKDFRRYVFQGITTANASGLVFTCRVGVGAACWNNQWFSGDIEERLERLAQMILEVSSPESDFRIPTPAEIEQELEERDAETTKIESQWIVDNLRKQWVGHNLGFSTSDPRKGCSGRVVKRLIEMFKSSGWSIRYHQDQKDGPYWTVEKLPEVKEEVLSYG